MLFVIKAARLDSTLLGEPILLCPGEPLNDARTASNVCGAEVGVGIGLPEEGK
jgi:hypothetical protein